MTNKRALIIGFGRAGKRHAKTLIEQFGFAPSPSFTPNLGFYDPHFSGGESLIPRVSLALGQVESEEEYLTTILKQGNFDFAVISTPPDLHLSQICQCLDAGLSVLCEKPLCGLGQLEEAEELLKHHNADKVMVSFNYRFHNKLIQARGKVPMWMTCWQDRELPEWGLLLDHCSHDLDILRFLCGDISIESAKYYPPGSMEQDKRRQMWEIMVRVPGLPEWESGLVRLRESVGTYQDRRAKLEYEDGSELDIDADPEMYRAMWEAFLSGNYSPNLEEAIKTQRLLERCYQLANETV